MEQGLDREEHAVQPYRRDDEKAGLQWGEGGPGRRHGEARQNQSEHRQRQDHGQKGVRSVEVVRLLVIPKPAEQEADAHQPVQDDHHDGEHVSRASDDSPWPAYMTAAIIIISMPLMESVST